MVSESGAQRLQGEDFGGGIELPDRPHPVSQVPGGHAEPNPTVCFAMGKPRIAAAALAPNRSPQALLEALDASTARTHVTDFATTAAM